MVKNRWIVSACEGSLWQEHVYAMQNNSVSRMSGEQKWSYLMIHFHLAASDFILRARRHFKGDNLREKSGRSFFEGHRESYFQSGWLFKLPPERSLILARGLWRCLGPWAHFPSFLWLARHRFWVAWCSSPTQNAWTTMPPSVPTTRFSVRLSSLGNARLIYFSTLQWSRYLLSHEGLLRVWLVLG